MNEDSLTSINRIPNEMLINIFLLLAPKSIMACRVVCWRWQQIIDDPVTSNKLWYTHCETDYSDIYQSAYVKSMPGLKWYQLYKSLTFWSRLSLNEETIHEINLMSSNKEYCSDFQVLRNGIIGVLTKNSIVYYDVDTLQVTKEFALSDNNVYHSYYENDDTMVLSSRSGQLFIRRTNNEEVITNIFDDVLSFLSLENVIYFVTNSNTMFKCAFTNGSYTSTCLVQIPAEVLVLGHENGTPCIFTNSNTIYYYVDNTLIQLPVNDSIYRWETISKFKFSDNFGWKKMCHYSFRYSISIDYLHYYGKFNICQIRIHGPVIIVGYEIGILCIFHSAYITNVSDLLEFEPAKLYYLFKPNEYLALDLILNIDVIEGDLSHTVIVAMTAKIVIIKFTHSHNSKEMSYSVKELSHTEVKSIESRKPSTSYEESSALNGGLSLLSGKASSSSGEASP